MVAGGLRDTAAESNLAWGPVYVSVYFATRRVLTFRVVLSTVLKLGVGFIACQQV
jgi:hypothetical protein